MVMTQVRHALEPLSADEIVAAMRILRAEKQLGERVRIAQVTLQEPPKADVLAGCDSDREAFIIVIEPDAQKHTRRLSHSRAARCRPGKRS